jgi:hypothetical protein
MIAPLSLGMDDEWFDSAGDFDGCFISHKYTLTAARRPSRNKKTWVRNFTSL